MLARRRVVSATCLTASILCACGQHTALGQTGFVADEQKSGSPDDAFVSDPELAVGPGHIVVANNWDVAYIRKPAAGSPFVEFYRRQIYPDLTNPPGEKGFHELPIGEFTSDPEAFYDSLTDRWWVMQFGRALTERGGLAIAVSDNSFPGDASNTAGVEGTWSKFYYDSFVVPNGEVPDPSKPQLIDSPDMSVDQDYVFFSAVSNWKFTLSGANRDWDTVYLFIFNKSDLLVPTPTPPQSVTPAQVLKITDPDPPLVVSTVVQKQSFGSPYVYMIESLETYEPGYPQNNPNDCHTAIRLRAIRQLATNGTWEQYKTAAVNLPTGWSYCEPSRIYQAPVLPNYPSPPALQTFDSRFWATPLFVTESSGQSYIWACHHARNLGDTNRVLYYKIALNGWPDGSNSPSLALIGQIAPTNRNAAFPSLAVNDLGDLCITYAKGGRPPSESTTDPAYMEIRRFFRRASTGSTSDVLVKQSTIPFKYEDELGSGRGRWGDYSGTVWDQWSPCHFYGNHEYAKVLGPSGSQYDGWVNWTERYNLCRADFDNDGLLSQNDLTEFAAMYASGDPSADINQDGTLNIDDAALTQDLLSKGMP